MAEKSANPLAGGAKCPAGYGHGSKAPREEPPDTPDRALAPQSHADAQVTVLPVRCEQRPLLDVARATPGCCCSAAAALGAARPPPLLPGAVVYLPLL